MRGVVTLGPVLSPQDFPAPDNVWVTARAPHAPILPLAAAVVTHAGHASALRPLMAGVPVVAMPLGRDQPDNARASPRAARACASIPTPRLRRSPPRSPG